MSESKACSDGIAHSKSPVPKGPSRKCDVGKYTECKNCTGVSIVHMNTGKVCSDFKEISFG